MVVAFKMSKRVVPIFYIEMVFDNFLRSKFNPGKNKKFYKRIDTLQPLCRDRQLR
jgi:hypothetical protein